MATHLSSQAIGDILDNYADVIEGGTAYRGSGTAHNGVPGTQSNDQGLRTGSEGSFTATGTPTTTVVPYSSGNWAQSRWVKDDTPGFFLIDENQDAARRITAWDNTNKEFTVGEAFPAAPSNGDTILIRQGFKRVPNGVDLLAEAEDGGVVQGLDRRFDLAIEPLQVEPFYGSGLETWSGLLVLRLRIEKHARLHDARASALENITILASALQLSTHYPASYVRAVLPMESAPEVEDDAATVTARIELPIYYRLTRAFD